MTDERIKRGPGRPRKEETPVRQNRPRRRQYEENGPLYIANPDPNYQYYWAMDFAENGPKVQRLLNRDWEFVTTDDNLEIGSGFEYEVKDVGSVYRVPADQSGQRYHFLMKIPKEWYEEDMLIEQERITKSERKMLEPDKAEGQYGINEIENASRNRY